jgi:hypothetical protein
MSEQFNISVTEDGLVAATPILTDHERESKLDQIIVMINDSSSSLATIKRMIAAEIATATRIMVHFGNDLTLLEGLKIKALDSQVKALRELGKELMESDVLSKKDFLNFDGPKLGFVLQEYRQGAQDTLKKMNIDESTVQQFLRLWRDWGLEAEPGIRKRVEKISTDEGKNKIAGGQ